MKTLNLQTTVPFTPLLLIVHAVVRYWEDAEIDGKEDEDGSLVPFREGDLWKPVIGLEDGRVLNWPIGTTAKIHYKVCDAGKYWLEDADGKRAEWKGYYVPCSLFCIGGHGCGDYIILNISSEGMIEGWKQPEIDEEEWILIA